mmetsp:Transcript_9976/g.24582  ORF Transcript_9976/g.24582 Transcript_9976/m.24582 type:complete len:111 (-) Transcript_9976:60-392(-)
MRAKQISSSSQVSDLENAGPLLSSWCSGALLTQLSQCKGHCKTSVCFLMSVTKVVKDLLVWGAAEGLLGGAVGLAHGEGDAAVDVSDVARCLHLDHGFVPNERGFLEVEE